MWTVFLSLTFLHIYANVKAVRALQLTSLNRSRMDILLQHCSATKVHFATIISTVLKTPVLWCFNRQGTLAHAPKRPI